MILCIKYHVTADFVHVNDGYGAYSPDRVPPISSNFRLVLVAIYMTWRTENPQMHALEKLYTAYLDFCYYITDFYYQ